MKSKITILVLAAVTGIIFSQNVFSEIPPVPDTDGIFWGVETNGVKVGLYVQVPQSLSNLPPIICYPYIKNSKTNNANLNSIHFQLWLPRIENAYRMSLLDEKGGLVAKTTKGEGLGKPIDQPLMVRIGGINFRAEYRALYPDFDEGAQLGKFILQDYFKIKAPGKYHLKLEVCVVWIQPSHGHDTNLYTINLPVVNLPPVNAEFQIRPKNIVSTNSSPNVQTNSLPQ